MIKDTRIIGALKAKSSSNSINLHRPPKPIFLNNAIYFHRRVKKLSDNLINFHQPVLIQLKSFGFIIFSAIPTIILATTTLVDVFGLRNTVHVYYIIILFFLFKHMYDNTSWYGSPLKVAAISLRVAGIMVMSLLVMSSFYFSWELNYLFFLVFVFFNCKIFYIIIDTEKMDKNYSLYYNIYCKYDDIIAFIYLIFINCLKKFIRFLFENPMLLLYIVFRIITFIYLGIEHLWYDYTLENFVFMNASEPSGKGGPSTGNSGHSGGEPGGKYKITWVNEGLKRKRDDFEEPNPPMDKYDSKAEYEACRCCGNMGTHNCICGGPRSVSNPYQYSAMGQPVLATACTDDYHSRGLPSYGLPCCRCRITVFNYLCTRCKCIYCRSCHYNITSVGSR